MSPQSEKWLWANNGNFVIVKRFSSKEEKRRIVATFYDGGLPFEKIGFDNKLNIFHSNKKGIDKEVALGLFVYLNSTLLDKYYRLFGGHTQINATDLKTIRYPNHQCSTINCTRGNNLATREFIRHCKDDPIIIAF